VNFGLQTAKNRTVVWRLLNAKFVFCPPPLKNVGAPEPLWGCVSKNWSFSTACENFRWKRPVTAEKWELVLRKCQFSMGLNYGPVFRRLWTKDHQKWLRHQTPERLWFATPFYDCRYLVPFRIYRVGQKTGPLCSAEILLRSARFFYRNQSRLILNTKT